MKRIIENTLIFILTIMLTNTLYAHSGGTDRNGGHTDRVTGVYHTHSSKFDRDILQRYQDGWRTYEQRQEARETARYMVKWKKKYAEHQEKMAFKETKKEKTERLAREEKKYQRYIKKLQREQIELQEYEMKKFKEIVKNVKRFFILITTGELK